jgi:hypothetical protein
MLTPERKAELKREWQTCPGGAFIPVDTHEEMDYLALLSKNGVPFPRFLSGASEPAKCALQAGGKPVPLDWMAM